MRVVCAIGLLACAAWVGCERADKSARQAAAPESLRPVALPGLEGYPESLRAPWPPTVFDM